MKIFKIFGLVWVGLLFLSSSLLADESSLSSRISYQFPHQDELALFLTPENISIATQIVRNLQGFKKEMENSHVLQEAHFEFILAGLPTQGFSGCVIRVFHPAAEPTALDPYAYLEFFQLEELDLRWGKIEHMRFHPIDEKALLEEIFDIYNIQYDFEKNILDRVILKSVLDASFSTKTPFYKFLEGKVIKYQAFNERSEPTSYEFKTFILDRDGTKVWTATKKSFNRRFNEQGLVTQETTQETTYSYSGLEVGVTFAIYNVSIHSKGEMAAYEIVVPQKQETLSYPQGGNLAINFERNNQGDLLRKLIREYRLTGGIKMYSQGKMEEITRDSAFRIKKTREVVFDVKPGSLGLLPEEQIFKEGLGIWNLAFNENGEVTSKRVLQTSFSELEINDVVEPRCLFKSFKNIEIIRDQGKMKRLGVDYYDFNDTKNLVLVRKVTIEVLEYMRTGDPAKIKLMIDTPQNPEARAEEIFIQDCNYMINEAVFGKLFDLKSKRIFDVHLEKVSENGDILEVKFHDYQMGGDQKI